jgi:uncharacterized membrane protein
MSPTVLKRAMLVITVLGTALAIYLTYIHYKGLNPLCSLGQSCIKVQSSQWSKVGGIPVALIGLIGYVGILLAQLIPEREEIRLALLGMTLIGFVFSAYLTYREIFSIKAICEECATSAVFMTLLFIASVIRYLRGDPPAATADPPAATVPPAKAAVASGR